MSVRAPFAMLCCAVGLALPVAGNCDELAERAAVMGKVVDLFSQQDFAALEALANTYRREQSRTSSGLWKLSLFNGGIDSAFHKGIKDDRFWTGARQSADEWVRRFPDSATARLAYAQMLINRGWSYRGTGYARSVRPQDWEPYRRYVQQARSYLEQHKDIASTDPRWYETMAAIAYQQSWPEADFTRLLNEGLDRHPGFYQIYFAAIEYYAPKWGGDAQSIERFARESLRRTQALEGFGMYARIYWFASQAQYDERLFTDSLVDWPTMMKGIDDVLKSYPDSWNVNNFAKFACLSRDKAKTAELIARIEGAPLLQAWGSVENFTRCKEWAAASHPAAGG